MSFAGKHCGKGGQMFMEIDLLIHFCPDILFTPDDTDACLSDTLLRGNAGSSPNTAKELGRLQ